MRYVKRKLVLRLTSPVEPMLLDELTDKFSDILQQGRFQLSGPLPDEADEPEWAEMPRVVFPFDRRSHGRLRQVIDCLNAGDLSPLAQHGTN